ncbi:hypothetical protein NADFUDRAFT_82402 [Nadsonia fulvescens var. elongata DSM 6958]|uniref:Uncharacterized protein n=1 Tax=Nadsonia fulvescens var. elongata DSM 6958 TaxID=857566 RepID=A0A1E3PMI1_9ASCO|nr:hypothetical protein NADFUDRAFT_82402 [Nadsonia fulvescens var. elongata DSM 6958]
MVKDFLNSVVEMLSLSSKNIISRIQSVDTLVSLRQRLLALLDAEEALRELKTADNTSWLAVIFREAWTDRFHFLINKSINGLSKIGEHIEKTYSDIITNSHGQSSITDDSDITQAIAKLKNSKKDLVCLFASLSTYSKGQFGDAKSIIRECEQWETQHQEVMNVVEVFGCLNDFFSKKNSKDVAHHIYDSQNIKEYSSIRSNYEEEDYSQSLDGVKWKRDELSNIKQDYESTVAFISSNTSKTYKAVIANLKKTLENTEYIKFKSCRALTFLSRVLLHFHHSIKEEQSITEELLSLVYRRLGTFLSGFIGDLLSEHIFNLCSGKDPIANSLWVMFSGYEILIPHSPTPSISAIVYQLCQEATDSLGEDQFIWESKSSLFVLNDAISAILASNIVCSLEKQFLFNNKLETNRSSIEENYKATSSDQLSETEGISSVKDSNQALSDTFDENIVETSVESQQVSVENKPDEPDVMINRAVQLYVDIEYLNYVFSTSNFDIALEILKKIIDDTLDNKSANSVYEALSMISSNHFQKTKMLFTPLCSS